MTAAAPGKGCSRIFACALAGLALLLGACAQVPLSPAAGEPAQAAASAASAPEGAASPPEAATPGQAAASAPQDAASAAARTMVTDPADFALDPLRPERPVDFEDRGARVDLWQRIRDGFSIPDLDDRYVRQREQFYASQPEYVARMTDRGSRYLFHIVEEVQRRGLPTELALLPFIESAFNPDATSRSRAAGMWQFMPSTGHHFDLKQNVFRDDRRDVLASTQAALDYLTRLNEMFDDWHLALAAYNWGEGNVKRAIRSNRARGRPTNYASLKMPWETRDYVPKLQAMKNIVLKPASYGLTLPVLENHPYFLAVPISRDIDVALVSQLAQIGDEEFRQLNPQMHKPVILAAGTPQVLLPYDNANAFVKSLQLYDGPLSSWTAWTVPRTMKPVDAARVVGMDEDLLREVNDIPPHMLVREGSTLLVHRNGRHDGDVPERIADNGMLSLAPENMGLKRMVLRVGRRGDSVIGVARRYSVSPQQVAQWNRLSVKSKLAPGSKVVVYVPNTKGAPARKTSKSTPSPRGAKPVAKTKRDGAGARSKRSSKKRGR